VRIWLKAGIVSGAGRWLAGTLFWPAWLRLAGMRIGIKCEVSTIIDVVPELCEIGDESFFADGIYLGGPRVHRGTVICGRTVLGKNSFLGNHAVIPPGTELPRDVLLGICTVAEPARVRAGTSWFGLPAFELPRRESVEYDRRFTHDPSLPRYLTRLFWELSRFWLPIPPVLAFVLWFKILVVLKGALPAFPFLVAAVPGTLLGLVAGFVLSVWLGKWALLGRVKPGTHPLWSCWCSRWDFLYVLWQRYALGAMSAFGGTPFTAWWLRAMGSNVGRRVVLGGGFAQVVDPDMLHFEDGATVASMFQAHTFEERVLKIDRVHIRRGATAGTAAVLLYGADIGPLARVVPHSVVMKREVLPGGTTYAGCPTRVLMPDSAGK